MRYQESWSVRSDDFQRCRLTVQNDPTTASAMDYCVSNVVGTGAILVTKDNNKREIFTVQFVQDIFRQLLTYGCVLYRLHVTSRKKRKNSKGNEVVESVYVRLVEPPTIQEVTFISHRDTKDCTCAIANEWGELDDSSLYIEFWSQLSVYCVDQGLGGYGEVVSIVKKCTRLAEEIDLLRRLMLYKLREQVFRPLYSIRRPDMRPSASQSSVSSSGLPIGIGGGRGLAASANIVHDISAEQMRHEQFRLSMEDQRLKTRYKGLSGVSTSSTRANELPSADTMSNETDVLIRPIVRLDPEIELQNITDTSSFVDIPVIIRSLQNSIGLAFGFEVSATTGTRVGQHTGADIRVEWKTSPPSAIHHSMRLRLARILSVMAHNLGFPEDADVILPPKLQEHEILALRANNVLTVEASNRLLSQHWGLSVDDFCTDLVPKIEDTKTL